MLRRSSMTVAGASAWLSTFSTSSVRIRSVVRRRSLIHPSPGTMWMSTRVAYICRVDGRTVSFNCSSQRAAYSATVMWTSATGTPVAWRVSSLRCAAAFWASSFVAYVSSRRMPAPSR
jgi:hypothetical protein